MSPPAAPVAPCWPSNVSDSGVTTPSTIWAIPPFRIVKGSSSPSKNTSVEDTHVDVVIVSKDGELEVVKMVPDSSGNVMTRSAVGSTTAIVVSNSSTVSPSRCST